jgi:ureidoacrylate peracid hydrolase
VSDRTPDRVAARLTEGTSVDSVRYDTANTALILIDVLNDFLADDGKLNEEIGQMRDELDLRSHLLRLLEGARAAGVKTFYAPHGLDEHRFDDVKYVHPTFQGGMARHLFWKGSYGADFYEPLKPIDGDVVVGRHRMYNSFVGTDLDDLLASNGIEKVVLAGLTTQSCVEGTGRHALDAGYHVTFLTDAVAEFTDAAHRAAIELSYPRFGHAVHS